MKQILFYLFGLSFLSVQSFAAGQSKEILLLSTPRSGKHFCLFTLCHLLDRQAIGNRGPCQSDPFGGLFDKNQKGIIYTAHNPKDLWIKKDGEQNDILILILRNYRECLYRDIQNSTGVVDEIRHMATMNDFTKGQILTHSQNHYFNNLRCFDLWDPEHKLLIYYEDLIASPESVLGQLKDFFPDEISEEACESFMQTIDFHRETCLEIYKSQGGSKTRGKDPLFYTSQMGRKNAEWLDREVRTLFPDLFEKYLTRYAIDPRARDASLYEK